MLFGIFNGAEKRSNPSPENPSYSLSDPATWAGLWGRFASDSGVEVSEQTALGVPAIWAAVQTISGTIAALPAHLYKTENGAPVKALNDPLYYLIHDGPNGQQTAQAFYKWLVSRLLLGGRALVFINRNKAGRVKALQPLDPSRVTVKQIVNNDGEIVRTYTYQLSNTSHVYQANEIIDLIWLPAADGFSHYNPISTHRDAIGLMIAVERYASIMFQNGGIPPLVLNSPQAMSPAAAGRASIDVGNAVKASQRNKSGVLVAPQGHELKPLGIDPIKQQMIEVRRFQISEVSRIFNIAPAILHDLSTGTYSNVEQQNLSFATQTIHPILELIEQEFNAKLFGSRNTSNYIEFNLDGLMRGDFQSRMEGLARAVNSALLTPNEARSLDNRGPLAHGDDLLIQGATVPLGSSVTNQNKNTQEPISNA